MKSHFENWGHKQLNFTHLYNYLNAANNELVKCGYLQSDEKISQIMSLSRLEEMRQAFHTEPTLKNKNKSVLYKYDFSISMYMHYVAAMEADFYDFENWIKTTKIKPNALLDIVVGQTFVLKKLHDANIIPAGKDLESYSDIKDLTSIKKEYITLLKKEKVSKKQQQFAALFFDQFIKYKKEKVKIYSNDAVKEEMA